MKQTIIKGLVLGCIINFVVLSIVTWQHLDDWGTSRRLLNIGGIIGSAIAGSLLARIGQRGAENDS